MWATDLLNLCTGNRTQSTSLNLKGVQGASQGASCQTCVQAVWGYIIRGGPLDVPQVRWGLVEGFSLDFSL